MKLLWTALCISLASASNLRSSCNNAPDQAACFATSDAATGEACAWCEAGAIPSECMSQEQAKDLPSGVFDCSTPALQSYVFASGRTVSVQADPEPSVNDICDDSVKSLSGYMDISGSAYDQDHEDKHLFFWMFEKRGDFDDSTPLIVWLTGGPGCSSTLALLTENGPCSVNDSGTGTETNPYSWNEAAHVLWLDQPAGVGFSYGKETDNNEKMISEDAYYFLQAFFQTYPQYASSPLYIVGESYGGHYAPSIAHRIWVGNEANADKTIRLNLAGLAVGNGLTDPENQYPYYPEMGSKNSHGIEVFDDATVEAMTAAVPTCTKLIHQCNSGDNALDNFACQSAFLYCNGALTSPYRMTGLNPYDIRKPCGNNPLCYDFSNVQKFLNLPDTKAALNVDTHHSHAWEACNIGINLKFHVDWMKDFSGFVADLLDKAGIPVLIYAGDVDFICNYMGNRAWTNALEWSGKSDFAAADEHEWKGYGLARSADNLTFLQVYDAGHMVPSDQPKVALEMISLFTQGGAF